MILIQSFLSCISVMAWITGHSVFTSSVPMLSTFTDVFTDFLSTQRLYTSVDYAVNRKYFITRRLSPVNHGKKSVVDNIGPSTQITTVLLLHDFCLIRTRLSSKVIFVNFTSFFDILVTSSHCLELEVEHPKDFLVRNLQCLCDLAMKIFLPTTIHFPENLKIIEGIFQINYIQSYRPELPQLGLLLNGSRDCLVQSRKVQKVLCSNWNYIFCNLTANFSRQIWVWREFLVWGGREIVMRAGGHS
jgi:hypothetical protein